MVERIDTVVATDDDGPREVSALRWGTRRPRSCSCTAARRTRTRGTRSRSASAGPRLAIDLPGHGHSGWRADGAYSPMNLADDVAVVIAELAPTARVVVGMSLGGMTAMELAVRHPALVRSLVMVDITPGVNAAKTKAVTDFVDGPQSFASFDELLARTMEFNPTRSESSLRRPVVLEGSRSRAIMVGTNGVRPRLQHWPAGAVPQEGDRVVTSAEAAAFPAGLPVGIVHWTGAGAPEVELFARLDRLDLVRLFDYGLGGILPPEAVARPEPRPQR